MALSRLPYITQCPPFNWMRPATASSEVQIFWQRRYHVHTRPGIRLNRQTELSSLFIQVPVLPPGTTGGRQYATAGGISVSTVPTASARLAQIVAGPDGALWFTESGANKIGRITTAGAFTEYPEPTGSAPQGIAAGPDNALWFTEQSGNKIGRITTAGVFSEYPIPTPGSAPFAITAGPDGALWFTESNANKIGRITTAGTVSEFPTPTAPSAPSGITD